MPRVSAENIRELLANGGYQPLPDSPMPRREAFVMALCDAAEHDHPELVRELIAEDPAAGESVEPLITALESHNNTISRLLLDHGAPINGRGGHSGETPLMAAAAAGYAVGVRMLLDCGADSSLLDGDDERDALGWAQMGGAEHNFVGGMPDDARAAYAMIIQMLQTHAGPAA